jgi:hypothetical protein
MRRPQLKPDVLSQHPVVREIAIERQRQIEVEGFTSTHDDKHYPGEIALAAACYAIDSYPGANIESVIKEIWPWEDRWWKPKGKRRDLIRAAALIVAEIERTDRAMRRPPSPQSDPEARV